MLHKPIQLHTFVVYNTSATLFNRGRQRKLYSNSSLLGILNDVLNDFLYRMGEHMWVFLYTYLECYFRLFFNNVGQFLYTYVGLTYFSSASHEI
jgi:hypothetical protein